MGTVGAAEVTVGVTGFSFTVKDTGELAVLYVLAETLQSPDLSGTKVSSNNPSDVVMTFLVSFVPSGLAYVRVKLTPTRGGETDPEIEIDSPSTIEVD